MHEKQSGEYGKMKPSQKNHPGSQAGKSEVTECGSAVHDQKCRSGELANELFLLLVTTYPTTYDLRCCQDVKLIQPPSLIRESSK